MASPTSNPLLPLWQAVNQGSPSSVSPVPSSQTPVTPPPASSQMLPPANTFPLASTPSSLPSSNFASPTNPLTSLWNSSSQPKTALATPTPPASKDSWLPTAMGIAGAIGGEAVFPGGGGVVGGAAMQGLGELMKEGLSGQKVSVPQVANQTATGGVFGFFPDLEGVGKLGTAALRFGAGAVAGAAKQAIDDVTNHVNLVKDFPNIGGSGVASGIGYALVGSLTDKAIDAIKYAFQDTPKDIINQVVVKGGQQAEKLYNTVMAEMVGRVNVEPALSMGILEKNQPLTTEYLQQAVDKTKVVAQETNDALMKKLHDAGDVLIHDTTDATGRTLSDLVNELKTTTKAAGNEMKVLSNRVSYVIDRDIQAPIVGASVDIIKDMSLPLTTVNEIKQLVGNYYKLPGMDSIYNGFKNFIEDTAGKNGVTGITELNQKAAQLMEIGKNLDKSLNNKNLPLKLTPEGIASAVRDAQNHLPSKLKVLVNSLAAAGYIGAGAVGISVLKELGADIGISTVGGIGMTFMMRKYITDLVESKMDSPEGLMDAADWLSKKYQTITSIPLKNQILQALQSLGGRGMTAVHQQYAQPTPPDTSQ